METNRIARLGSSLAWCKGVSKRHYLSHSALEAFHDQFLNDGNGGNKQERKGLVTTSGIPKPFYRRVPGCPRAWQAMLQGAGMS